MVFLLVGLTNKQFGEWTDPTVGGFILVGIIGTLLFIVAESRAKEPIVPLHLWTGRTYSATMVSVFFAAFAFFGAIVFLPRWFQVVEGFSPTNSGLAALPLMVGLIFSSIVSGLIVARTGRYKWLIVGSVAVMGFAVLLMTQLTKDTPVPVVWLWMFIAGLGVGPTFSVPTIVIQNAVPFRELGVATSNLTFFRQIGGTISLAFVGTIFATSFKDNLIPQMSAAGVPQQVTDGFTQASANGSFDTSSLTGVGDLGAAILKAIPRRVPGGGPAVRRRHGRGHPRGIQPRDRPDVLARRGRRDHRRQSPPWRSRRSRSGRRTRRRSRPPPSAPTPGPVPDGSAEAVSASADRPPTDLRSSSRSTAPVDPTGVVVRPRRVAFEAMDPRPAPFPATLRALGTSRRTARSRPSSTSPTCRPARCAVSAGATSTSCWRTRPSGSSRPTTAART